MATKAEFNAEEWETVVEGPPSAGLAVVMADRGGALRESVAMARAYARARQARGPSTLLDEIVAAPPTPRPPQAGAGEDVRAELMERVRRAVAIVAERGGEEDAAEYRAFVLDVAEGAAAAHKEGGFLGVGGRESATPSARPCGRSGRRPAPATRRRSDGRAVGAPAGVSGRRSGPGAGWR